ncbi:MAG: puuC, partial [Steroidobacteraceae bacterium]|nr:puuC [Steroidobacteraceae bacterium]
MAANPISAAEWRSRAAALKPRSQVFIDGRFVSSVDGATFDNINPATGKSLGAVAAGDQADIDRAVASARAAFRKANWADMPPKARKKVLLR